jgi:4'-phosphopantetheinyl transferase
VADRTPCLPLVKGVIENGVEVWRVDLDDRTVAGSILDAMLSPGEQERAARFVFEPDAWHFKLCRTLLRLGLALHLGKPARELHIQTAERGKPFVDEGGIHFNVSHCRGDGLLAFTRAGEIGVDIEAVHPNIEGLDIASEHFTAGEAQWIAAATNPREQAQRFTRLWTRKEAVLKASGKGIVDGLNSFDISRKSSATIRSLRHGDTREVHLIVKDIPINESVYAAIAGPDSGWEVQAITVAPAALLDCIRISHPYLL